MSKNEKTKSELEKELREIETLEEKVRSKKSAMKYAGKEIPFKVGDAYFFRTVTYHATGRVKAVVGDFLVLDDAAWVADSGRFRDAIMKGILSEVEPVEVDMYLNINSITDAFEWKNALPDKQK
jgi:hypothetical protein